MRSRFDLGVATPRVARGVCGAEAADVAGARRCTPWAVCWSERFAARGSSGGDAERGDRGDLTTGDGEGEAGAFAARVSGPHSVDPCIRKLEVRPGWSEVQERRTVPRGVSLPLPSQKQSSPYMCCP
mmetsp:Transcript_91702/g.273635  ORF Transcript_91702/g.273635 Transcript_91702/m.273635 type:complete len:127 (+) Transcript_91702:291-671(+)